MKHSLGKLKPRQLGIKGLVSPGFEQFLCHWGSTRGQALEFHRAKTAIHHIASLLVRPNVSALVFQSLGDLSHQHEFYPGALYKNRTAPVPRCSLLSFEMVAAYNHDRGCSGR